ncbi:hypothetical protein ACFLZN_01390 [Nanoarchaeota archaeon]
MVKLGKYAKIVILSTLAESRSLVDISTTWFNNKGRLYQSVILNEIKKACQKKWLIQEGKKSYRADIPKLTEQLIGKMGLGENNKITKKYLELVKKFYLNLGEYTQKVYLNFDVIKALTGLDQNKAEEIDLALLFQLPFLLRYMELQNKDLTNIFIQVMKLEEYVKTVEKLEIQYLHVLKEKRQVDDWVELFEQISKLLPKMQKKELPIFQKNIEAMKAFGG